MPKHMCPRKQDWSVMCGWVGRSSADPLTVSTMAASNLAPDPESADTEG